MTSCARYPRYEDASPEEGAPGEESIRVLTARIEMVTESHAHLLGGLRTPLERVELCLVHGAHVQVVARNDLHAC